MELTCLRPVAKYDDIETGFVSVLAKSVSSAKQEGNFSRESTNLNVHDDVESALKNSGASRKMLAERSISLQRKELETSESLSFPTVNKDNNILINRSISHKREATATDSPRSTNSGNLTPKSSLMIQGSSEHEAAMKLQKVYKSFRTRRKLADCAVLVEQSWWKLLDFVELKRSSISFFDVDKHETAISRWSRARTRAAKVGKGLSKNSKAQKLALQHWLEAIDPRHRYGHNLHFYYVKWLQSQGREPFFYWLDLGEGKEMNLVEKCSRSQLQNQCIKYLDPMERKAYEIELENGKFFKKQTKEILDTTGGPKGAKWIFVLSTSRTLYVGKKQKGTFQHSSFLAGGATSAAGQLVVENGTLRAVWPHSGHYRPTEENFKDFISFLRENNVDLTNVQMTPVDQQQRSCHRQRSNLEMRINLSEEEMTQKATCSDVDQANAEGLAKVIINLVGKEVIDNAVEFHKSRKQHRPGRKITYLEIPTRDEFLQTLQSEDQITASSGNNFSLPPPLAGFESPEEEEEHEASKQNSSGDVHEKGIIERVKPRKDSCQLGNQLSCTWTSGVGPRIGCVRDYPWELQNKALEKVNLSPRSAPISRSLSNFTTPHYKNGTRTPKPLTILRHATSSPPDKILFSQRSLPHFSTLSSSFWKANSVGITSFS